MHEYLTVVIQLPPDKESRKKISSELRLGENFHGGRITGMSLADELTLNEELTKLGGEDLLAQAETQVAQIHMSVDQEPLSDVKFEALPNYGNLMTLAEFNESEDDGSLNSDDGSGYFATLTQMSQLSASGAAPAWATHVMWFGK